MSVLEYGVAPGRIRVVLAPIDGDPFLVVDARQFDPLHGSCFVTAGAAGEALALSAWRSGIGGTIERYEFTGPAAIDPLWRVPVAHLLPGEFGSVAFGFPRVSGRTVALSADGVVVRSNPSTGRYGVVARTGQVPGDVCCGDITSTATYFLAGRGTTTEWVALGDATPQLLYTYPTGTSGYSFIHDGDMLYWLELRDLRDGGGWGVGDVLGSPLTTDRASLQPQVIARLPSPDVFDLVIAHGRMAYTASTALSGAIAYVVDLGDGTYQEFRPPTGLGVSAIAFVTTVDVGFLLGVPGAPHDSVVYRIRYSGLGPRMGPLPTP